MKYRIQALWNRYRTEVMPPDCPDVQVIETRRAFYAGVESALNKLASEMSEGDPNDERMLMEVQQELTEFVKKVKFGQA